MFQKDIDIIEHIEDESYMDVTTSSSNPMEVQLKPYGSFKGQRNPLFEPSHQIGDPMSKRFYEKNNYDKRSNEVVGNLMEEFDEVSSYDVFTPSLCSKSLDGDFLCEENVYFNPLFLEGGISIDDTQVGMQRKGSRTIAP